MGAHQVASGFWTAPLHGFKNSFVMKLPVLWTALNSKDPEALFPQ